MAKGKKGGGKKSGTKKKAAKTATAVNPFTYEPLTAKELKLRSPEYVRCRVCNTEMPHLNFELPAVSTDTTLSSLKQAIQRHHGRAVHDVILFLERICADTILSSEGGVTLEDVGVRGGNSGRPEELPTTTLFYDFPLSQRSSDPILTAMMGQKKLGAPCTSGTKGSPAPKRASQGKASAEGKQKHS